MYALLLRLVNGEEIRTMQEVPALLKLDENDIRLALLRFIESEGYERLNESAPLSTDIAVGKASNKLEATIRVKGSRTRALKYAAPVR